MIRNPSMKIRKRGPETSQSKDSKIAAKEESSSAIPKILSIVSKSKSTLIGFETQTGETSRGQEGPD